MEINADLHAHSRASDGLLTPAEVVRLAAANGVTLFALTDHDELSGIAEAKAAARSAEMGFLSGVEISVSWREHTLHVVGLGIDETAAPLCEGLAGLRKSREQRACRIAQELGRFGVEDALKGAQRHATNPAVISRTHFARYLVEINRARDVKAVFQRFLARGKPGYVPHQWAPIEEAVGWITQSGGVATLAHPGRYALSLNEMETLLSEFRDAGGRGIEVITGNHSPDQAIRFTRLAIKYGLAASRGADYHGPGESRVEPGRLPALPPRLQPVWDLL